MTPFKRYNPRCPRCRSPNVESSTFSGRLVAWNYSDDNDTRSWKCQTCDYRWHEESEGDNFDDR